MRRAILAAVPFIALAALGYANAISDGTFLCGMVVAVAFAFIVWEI